MDGLHSVQKISNSTPVKICKFLTEKIKYRYSGYVEKKIDIYLLSQKLQILRTLSCYLAYYDFANSLNRMLSIHKDYFARETVQLETKKCFHNSKTNQFSIFE